MATEHSHSDWWTPPDFKKVLMAEFNFDLDAAASAENTICPDYIGEEENALIYPWAHFPCNCLHALRSGAINNSRILFNKSQEVEWPRLMVPKLSAGESQKENGLAAETRAREGSTGEAQTPLQPARQEVEKRDSSSLQPQTTGSASSLPMVVSTVDGVSDLVGSQVRLLRKERDGARSRNTDLESDLSGDSSLEHSTGLQELQQQKEKQGPKCPYCGVLGTPTRNVYLNPPYGKGYDHMLARFIKRAYEQHLEQRNTVVMLIPAYTDPKYWRDYCTKAHEIRFLTGRLAFLDHGVSKMSARFPSALVIFKWFPGVCYKAANTWVWQWRS